MNEGSNEELAAGHALDLLEPDEQRAFGALLAGNAALRSETDELRQVAAALALAVPQVAPPPHLRGVILAAADRSEPATATAGTNWIRLVPWALAAGLAFSTGWFALRSISLQAANRSLETSRQLADLAQALARSQLAERTLVAERMIGDLGDRLRTSADLRRLRVCPLAPPDPQAKALHAVAVWDPERQTGLLAVDHLPAVAEESDYQIWVIDPQYPAPLDGGVFRPGADGRATVTFKCDRPVADAAAFAVSLERKGGAPRAEGPLVLLGRR